MSDVAGLLDALDLVVARAAGVVSDEVQAEAAAAVRALRSRRGFVGETLILAIVGGTGSGKSSLLNALAGKPVASVSAIRPHTDEPLAWIPAGAGSGLIGLLDDLGIHERVSQDVFPGIAVLDMPDVDSVADWHRRQVEELLPRIDAALWLFDPEKYHDPVVHDELLAPLAEYADQFIFGLNKIDVLRPDDRIVVADDLEAILEDEGYPEPLIFSMAADPPDGVPLGVGALSTYLSDKMDAKRVALGKLVGDVRSEARRLADAAVVWRGWSVDFEPRWARIRDATAEGLASGTDQAALEDALCRVEDFVAAISVETGLHLGSRIRAAFPPDRIGTAVAAARQEAGPGPEPQPRKRRQRERAIAARAAALGTQLDEQLGNALRDLLRERSLMGASVASVGVAVHEVEARLQ